jgi:mannose-6-phosphate isomerase-like protein (cupin superfamily)
MRTAERQAAGLFVYQFPFSHSVPPAYPDAHRNLIRGGTAMISDSNRDVTQLSPLWREHGTGPTLDVLGVTHIYKAMASETGQQFSLWESIVPPGAGAPPHTHTREDEAFYVLSGHVLSKPKARPIRYISAPADLSLLRAIDGTPIAISVRVRRACWCSRSPATASIACLQPSTPPAANTCRRSPRSLQSPRNMAS